MDRLRDRGAHDCVHGYGGPVSGERGALQRHVPARTSGRYAILDDREDDKRRKRCRDQDSARSHGH